MRYIVTLVWGIILGQVAGFLIGALNGSSYDPMTSLITSVVFVIILFTLPAILAHYDTTPAKAKK